MRWDIIENELGAFPPETILFFGGSVSDMRVQKLEELSGVILFDSIQLTTGGNCSKRDNEM